MLARSPEKTATFLGYVGSFMEESRALIFSETKQSSYEIAASASNLGFMIEAYTSDLLQPDRRAILERFRAGGLQALVAPKILDEGVDVPEADVGVIISASRSRRQMIQRMGRVIRPKDDGRVAHFVIFYIKESTEDPRRGPHEEFIAEMLDVAEEVTRFDGINDVEIFGEWWAAGECFGSNWEPN
jgi:superfamily II DNA or RNA helicase